MNRILNQVEREIDKFGRFSVPVEYREGMGVNRKGGPVLLSLGTDGSLTIRSKKRLSSYREQIREDLRALHELTGLTVLVCDTETVIAGAGGDAAGCEGGEISELLKGVIAEQTDYSYDEGERLRASERDLPLVERAIPLTHQDKGVGALVVLGSGPAPAPADRATEPLLQYAAQVVRRYLQ